MKNPEPSIAVKVDVTNPGQFFACCGLLELVCRAHGEAVGWFDLPQDRFCIQTPIVNTYGFATKLLEWITDIEVANTMSENQLLRRSDLSAIPKKKREAGGLEEEKKRLDKLWRESPIVLKLPGTDSLRLDWFLDDYAGGSTFKTWAGQQSVIDIAAAMKKSITPESAQSVISEDWFSEYSNNGHVPFNFDAELGSQGSSVDIGFGTDALQVSVGYRPVIEFLAFVGLQRFRPAPFIDRNGRSQNRYHYRLWMDSLPPEIAAITACGHIDHLPTAGYEFRLLYRTKYLKSFLPATPLGASR